MRLNVANNAETKLSETVTASDTTMKVANASVFPEVPFLMTMNRNEEIVKVIDASGNKLTVERSQEETTAQDWVADTVIQHHLTAGMYEELETVKGAQDKADSALTDANKYTDNEIDKIPEVDLKPYAKKTEVEEVSDSLTSHLNSDMPHQFTSDGKTYRYGIAMQDGEIGVLYEEVL